MKKYIALLVTINLVFSMVADPYSIVQHAKKIVHDSSFKKARPLIEQLVCVTIIGCFGYLAFSKIKSDQRQNELSEANLILQHADNLIDLYYDKKENIDDLLSMTKGQRANTLKAQCDHAEKWIEKINPVDIPENRINSTHFKYLAVQKFFYIRNALNILNGKSASEYFAYEEKNLAVGTDATKPATTWAEKYKKNWHPAPNNS